MITTDKEKANLVITIPSPDPGCTAENIVSGLFAALKNQRHDSEACKTEWAVYNICEVLEAMMPDAHQYEMIIKMNGENKPLKG